MDQPVIKGSFASPEAVAHLMTQKFVMGVPLYRQEQEWKRQSLDEQQMRMFPLSMVDTGISYKGGVFHA